MRPLAALLALFLAACSGGGATDAGPTDTGSTITDTGPWDGLACSDYTRICQSPSTFYGLCCGSCPGTDAGCAAANPGVPQGEGTVVLMCTKMCGNGGDCPNAPNGALGLCVRGICYQSCDAPGSTCPEGESCVMLYGHGICTAVECQ
jgi:hypothetical protein